MLKLLVVLSMCTILISCTDATETHNCDHLGTLLYEDLKFEPETVKDQPCPVQYKPKNYQNTEDHCFFQSKKLVVGQEVDNDLTYPSCNVGCRCNAPVEGHQNLTSFACAVLDCPEWLGSPLEKPGCYRTYALDKCCSTGSKCPPFDDLPKCEHNGTTYKEGEKFYPKHTCLECLCKDGFIDNETLNEPFCKRKTCASQIRHSDEISRNCAPVYLNDVDEALCCPSEWVCPSENDAVKKIKSTDEKTVPGISCTFGDKVLRLGEGVETKFEYYDGKERDVTCECILPPFLTCKEPQK